MLSSGYSPLPPAIADSLPERELPNGWVRVYDQKKRNVVYFNTLDGSEQSTIPTEDASFRVDNETLFFAFESLILKEIPIELTFSEPIKIHPHRGEMETHTKVKVISITKEKLTVPSHAIDNQLGTLDGTRLGILRCVSSTNRTRGYYYSLEDSWPFVETKESIIEKAQDEVWKKVALQLGGYKKSKKRKSKKKKSKRNRNKRSKRISRKSRRSFIKKTRTKKSKNKRMITN